MEDRTPKPAQARKKNTLTMERGDCEVSLYYGGKQIHYVCTPDSFTLQAVESTAQNIIKALYIANGDIPGGND